jgi:hypothetical protein
MLWQFCHNLHKFLIFIAYALDKSVNNTVSLVFKQIVTNGCENDYDRLSLLRIPDDMLFSPSSKGFILPSLLAGDAGYDRSSNSKYLLVAQTAIAATDDSVLYR